MGHHFTLMITSSWLNGTHAQTVAKWEFLAKPLHSVNIDCSFSLFDVISVLVKTNFCDFSGLYPILINDSIILGLNRQNIHNLFAGNFELSEAQQNYCPFSAFKCIKNL